MTEAALIDAINTLPEGEWQAAALMYADWLCERGDERAHGIREFFRDNGEMYTSARPTGAGPWEVQYVWTSRFTRPWISAFFATRCEALLDYGRYRSIDA